MKWVWLLAAAACSPSAAPPPDSSAAPVLEEPEPVAVGRTRVRLFHSADCSGSWELESQADQAAYFGVYLQGEPTRGPLSMKSYRADGGEDPCSNAVSWR